MLEKAGLIKSSKIGNKLVYYPSDFNAEDLVLMVTLKNNTAKRIVDYLARIGRAHLRKIAGDLDISVETVRYNLKKLERAGVVLSEEEGNRIVYYINPAMVFTYKE
jgi:predicted transcriptional regulator